jgi:RNA-directed DNA polymerase
VGYRRPKNVNGHEDSPLVHHADTPIRRHVKVRGSASPYDGNLVYWAQRLRNHPLL